jgi:hypothetical protein
MLRILTIIIILSLANSSIAQEASLPPLPNSPKPASENNTSTSLFENVKGYFSPKKQISNNPNQLKEKNTTQPLPSLPSDSQAIDNLKESTSATETPSENKKADSLEIIPTLIPTIQENKPTELPVKTIAASENNNKSNEGNDSTAILDEDFNLDKFQNNKAINNKDTLPDSNNIPISKSDQHIKPAAEANLQQTQPELHIAAPITQPIEAPKTIDIIEGPLPNNLHAAPQTNITTPEVPQAINTPKDVSANSPIETNSTNFDADKAGLPNTPSLPEAPRVIIENTPASPTIIEPNTSAANTLQEMHMKPENAVKTPSKELEPQVKFQDTPITQPVIPTSSDAPSLTPEAKVIIEAPKIEVEDKVHVISAKPDNIPLNNNSAPNSIQENKVITPSTSGALNPLIPVTQATSIDAGFKGTIIPKLNTQPITPIKMPKADVKIVNPVKLTPRMSEKEQFIKDETVMLQLKDDEMILGALQEEAYLNLLEFDAYVKLFWKNYYGQNDLGRKDEIDNFLYDYEDKFYGGGILSFINPDDFTNGQIDQPLKEGDLRLEVINATINGNFESLRVWIDNYPLLNIRDEEGNNLLALAVINDHSQIVRYLLDKGIDYHNKNDYNESALDLAIKKNNRYIIKLLQNAERVDAKLQPSRQSK